MNGYQIKQRDKVLDPNRFPVRALTTWELDFQRSMRRWTDNKELSKKQNKALTDLAALFA